MSWSTMLLGDAVTLKRGYDLPTSKRRPGEVPIVSSSGVTGRHNESKVEGPGVVTGRYGTLGEVYYIRRDFWPLNTALYVQDFKDNDRRFVAYFLRYILRNTVSDKAAVPGVNRNDLHARVVTLPDKQIQEKTAAILGAYDDLIENNRRRIQLLEQSARLLYKEWFVHLRFPGRGHMNVGALPRGWEKIPLGDALSLQRGFDITKVEQEPGDVPVISSSGVRSFHSKSMVDGPGIVIGRKGTLGMVHFSEGSYWPHDTTLWVKEFKKILPKFAWHLLDSMHLERYDSGVAVPTLNRNHIHCIEILCPPRSLQAEFSECTHPLYGQSRVLGQQNSMLQKARDLLLPRLMNGDIPI